MTRALYISLLVLLVSCSAEQRLNMLLARHPEFRDTVFTTDTVTAIVEYVHHDTTFVPVAGDTVRIDDGRLHVRYVKMLGDTVFLAGTCDPDTVTKVVEHRVPVVQPAIIKKEIPWWVYVVGALLLLSLILALIKR